MRALLGLCIAVALLATASTAFPFVGGHAKPHHVQPLKPIKWTHRAKHDSNIPGRLLGEVASATIMLHESLFRKIIDAALPSIISDVQAIQIPGESGHDYSFDTITISEFGISGLNISFSAPNQVSVTITNMSLATPSTHFDVWVWVIFKISCSGNFDVSLTNTDVTLTFAFDETNDLLNITDVNAAVSFGSLNVHHDFPNFFCKVGQDIIQLFIGNIDHKIRDAVENDISPLLTKDLKKAFNGLASKLKLPLVTAPVATTDSISFDVDLLHRDPKISARRNAMLSPRRLLPTPRLVGNSSFPARDIEVMIPQLSVDTILSVAQASGALTRTIKLKDTTKKLKELLPAAYAACPDCPLALDINVQNAPTASLSGSASVALTDAIVGINALNGTQSIDLVDLLLNATALATNFTVDGTLTNVIDFAIAVPVFAVGVYQSAIGPIDASLLTWLGNLVVQDYIVPDFNTNFKGLPIGPIGNVTITDIEVGFPQAVDVGLDIKLPTV